jgi:hypothetical protein
MVRVSGWLRRVLAASVESNADHAPDGGDGGFAGGRYDQQQFDMRSAYAHEWASGDLITAPCHKPLELYTPCWCLVAAACAPCFSYQMRYRALYNRMENYTCCAGYAPTHLARGPREGSFSLRRVRLMLFRSGARPHGHTDHPRFYDRPE